MFRQIRRFGLIGLSATAIHVCVAFAVEAATALPPQLANTAGFLTAFLFSYIGHLRYTFEKKAHARIYLLRFMVLSGFGYLLSSGTVYAVTRLLEQDFLWAMVAVAAIVPAATFLIARFWAFSDAPAD